MKAEVIIVAGGKSKRFKSRLPKQFVKLKGKPVFLWSIEAFNLLPFVKKIIVVVPKNALCDLSKKYKGLKKVVWAAGGKERYDSVKEGLKLIDKKTDFIAVHDGARPLTTKADIKEVFKQAFKTKAAIAATKTKDTIKVVSKGKIVKTLNRDILWNAQTPQIFKKNLLFKAYSKKISAHITDDASLVENLGAKVSIVQVKSPNFKITTKQDLKAAQNILSL
jgi:2-C-methyl-D-erythritol 4-phosphate cytidylyltransferase